MKLYGSKRSFPRSFPPGPSLRFRAALVAGSAMTGLWEPARSAGASPGGLTAGTVGLGPKAWDEVFASALAPGVLAPDPTGNPVRTCTASNASVAVRRSLPSRSVKASTRLETRTKESNICASHRVD